MLKCQKVKTANIIHLKGCRFGQKEQLFGCFFLGTKKKDLLITNCKTNEFKTNMKKNIEAIYESSCFKMDTIFSLEFDKKKYYEDLKEKSQLEQTNNTNDKFFFFLIP